MTPEEHQHRLILLVMQEVADCLGDLTRLALQPDDAGNAGLRSGIALGLQRAAAHLMGKPFAPEVEKPE